MTTAVTRTNTRPATPAQLSYLTALVRDRALPVDIARVLTNVTEGGVSATTREASLMIEAAKAYPYRPRTARPAAAATPATGATVPAAPVPLSDITPAKGDVYIIPSRDLVIRVRENQARTALYALSRPATVTPDAAPEPFSYAPGVLRNLPADTRRLTLEEATALSAAWGECYRCGRTLTDPASIAKGIGPVCITYVTG